MDRSPESVTSIYKATPFLSFQDGIEFFRTFRTPSRSLGVACTALLYLLHQLERPDCSEPSSCLVTRSFVNKHQRPADWPLTQGTADSYGLKQTLCCDREEDSPLVSERLPLWTRQLGELTLVLWRL